jgi:hypothetical protein
MAIIPQKQKSKRTETESARPVIARRLFTMYSYWQAKESIPHATVTFYGYCVKMCEDFTPSFGNERTGCCIMTMHHLKFPFSPGNLLPETA